ncbi:histone H1-delta-like [Saccostrea echinata]|uniref:histone H1-delta-like n=1 Tax=Saccostrea echinata TaxID=191078 RepID=UPI002A7FF5DC|nr:histone H1-delta-like [Saccostrea echinata]
MADVTDVPVKKTPKKKTAAKPKKHADHPKYLDMVITAIKALKERKGSSRHAIVKYVQSNNKVGDDKAKVNTRVKAALRNGVRSGALKQTKGVGAQGRFSLGEKKAAVKKPKAAKKQKSPVKKPKVKKPKAAKKPAGEKKTKKVKKASPKKVKAAKPKAAKPKAAKKSPKKAKAAKPKKAKSPKKTGAKKVAKK